MASRLALSGGKGPRDSRYLSRRRALTDARTQIAELAEYYLVADPKKTMIMFNGGYEPATGWNRHWTDAVNYNIGQPWATGWCSRPAPTQPIDR